MPTVSAGLLMFRRSSDGTVEYFIAHMGGPYYARKDERAWTIPKGECEDADRLLECARREFEEETGMAPPDDNEAYIDLGHITQKGGKQVHAWGFQGDWEEGRKPASNTFSIEWPPRSGRRHSFPEIDRVAFAGHDEAARRLVSGQATFLDRLQKALGP